MEVAQLLKKNGQLLTSVLPAFYSFFFPNFVNIDGVVDDGDDDSDDADHLVDISFRHNNSNKLSEGAAVELIHQTSLVMQLMVNVVVALLQLVLHQLVLLIRRSMNVDSLWIPILSSM
ncbi:unnamed protein product [Gongylonema pulchrum]|uniref:Transmembrane protein n=1 Tax=Gongylonema pulchrum TaxID=637853 RepID=A0A183CY21_9BILA|nr:unnamed protein product [Gongylonema pulchrum]